jgi:hypothetical protein
MNSARRFAIVLLLTAVLAACTLELSPATSATVERYSNGRPVQTSKLTEQQLHLLSAWFAEHKSGWSRSYVTYAPAIYVRVSHVGGKPSSININSPTAVVVNYEGSQLEQQFEAAAVQNLISIIGASGG